MKSALKTAIRAKQRYEETGNNYWLGYAHGIEDTLEIEVKEDSDEDNEYSRLTTSLRRVSTAGV